MALQKKPLMETLKKLLIEIQKEPLMKPKMELLLLTSPASPYLRAAPNPRYYPAQIYPRSGSDYGEVSTQSMGGCLLEQQERQLCRSHTRTFHNIPQYEQAPDIQY